jgi:hypothetical protein
MIINNENVSSPIDIHIVADDTMEDLECGVN